MRNFLSTLGTIVMGIVVLAVAIGGCALYERGKDLLPGPARAVVDSLDSAGPGGFGPLGIQPTASQGSTSPLDACPDYAADVDALNRAVQGDMTAEQTQATDIAAVLQAQVDRLQAGGTPGALSATGVDAALVRQNDLLTGAANRIRGATYGTTQVQSLATSFAAALDAIADANAAFLAGGTGVRTRSAWMNWASHAAAPYDQMKAIAVALGKCP